MALVVISVDRDTLPSHTDAEFREWIAYSVGESHCIDIGNPLRGEVLDAKVREIG